MSTRRARPATPAPTARSQWLAPAAPVRGGKRSRCLRVCFWPAGLYAGGSHRLALRGAAREAPGRAAQLRPGHLGAGGAIAWPALCARYAGHGGVVCGGPRARPGEEETPIEMLLGLTRKDGSEFSGGVAVLEPRALRRCAASLLASSIGAAEATRRPREISSSRGGAVLVLPLVRRRCRCSAFAQGGGRRAPAGVRSSGQAMCGQAELGPLRPQDVAGVTAGVRESGLAIGAGAAARGEMRSRGRWREEGRKEEGGGKDEAGRQR